MPNYLESSSSLLKHRGIYIFSPNSNGLRVFGNFFDNLNKSKTKLEKISLTIKAISSKEIEESGFAAIYLIKDKVYCGLIGNAKIVIERGGNKYELFSKSDGIRMGSGKFVSGDKIIISFTQEEIVLTYRKISYIRYFLLFLINIIIEFLRVLLTFFRHKSLPVFGFIVLVCLLISMLIGTSKRKEIEIDNQKRISVNQINEDISKIRALYITDTKASWNYYQSIREKIVNDSDLLLKLDSITGELFKVENANLANYFDFGLVDENFKINKFGGSSGFMVFASNNGKIVSLDSKDKHTEVYKFDGVSFDSITSYLDNIYFQSGDTVLDIDKNTVLGGVGSSNLIRAYGGNLYVLDQDKDLIFRASGDALKFSNLVKWFSEGITTPTEIGGWSIDGAIWVISKNGVVFRYTGGTIASYYTLNDAFFESIEVKAFYTDETLSNLYVLYKDGGVVGVYTKEGKFLKEYRIGNGIKFSDIYVSSKTLKLIGISENRLYSIELVDPV